MVVTEQPQVKERVDQSDQLVIKEFKEKLVLMEHKVKLEQQDQMVVVLIHS